MLRGSGSYCWDVLEAGCAKQVLPRRAGQSQLERHLPRQHRTPQLHNLVGQHSLKPRLPNKNSKTAGELIRAKWEAQGDKSRRGGKQTKTGERRGEGKIGEGGRSIVNLKYHFPPHAQPQCEPSLHMAVISFQSHNPLGLHPMPRLFIFIAAPSHSNWVPDSEADLLHTPGEEGSPTWGTEATTMV